MYKWLEEYIDLQEEIIWVENKLLREKRELKRWISGDLFGVRLTKGSIATGLEERIEMMEYNLAHKMNDLYDLDKLIQSFSGLENDILYLRYCKGMKLTEVADQLGYTQQYIYNKHAQIKKQMSYTVDNKELNFYLR